MPVFVCVCAHICVLGREGGHEREDMKRVSHADNMCDKAGRQAGRSLQAGLGEASALAGPGVEVDGKPHQQGL